MALPPPLSGRRSSFARALFGGMAPLGSSSYGDKRHHSPSSHHHHHHHHSRGRGGPASPSLPTKSSLSTRYAPLKQSGALADNGRSHVQSVVSWLRHFVLANFLSLGFLVALAFALVWPEPGRAVAAIRICNGKVRIVSLLNNCLVFLVSGLTMRMSHLKKLGAHWYSVLYGVVAILLVTPLLSLVALRLPLEPIEFRQGLAVFAIVPSTMGVGVALTQAAHGNLAMAVLLTVATNTLGVVTVPYLLQRVVLQDQQHHQSSSSSSYISPSELVSKLLLTVLIPTSLGVAIRALSPPRLRHFITHHRAALSIFSSTNLFLIIWQSLSGARDLILHQRVSDLLSVAVAALSLSGVCLGLNLLVTKQMLRLDPPEAVAVIIMASMKSGIVAIAIISYLTPDLATAGLLVIPCIMGQLVQIFMGSALARRLAIWVDQYHHQLQLQLQGGGGGSYDRRDVGEGVDVEKGGEGERTHLVRAVEVVVRYDGAAGGTAAGGDESGGGGSSTGSSSSSLSSSGGIERGGDDDGDGGSYSSEGGDDDDDDDEEEDEEAAMASGV